MRRLMKRSIIFNLRVGSTLGKLQRLSAAWQQQRHQLIKEPFAVLLGKLPNSDFSCFLRSRMIFIFRAALPKAGMCSFAASLLRRWKREDGTEKKAENMILKHGLERKERDLARMLKSHGERGE